MYKVVDEEATKEKQAKADEEAKAAGKEAADPVEPAMRSESKEIWDWRVQNDNKPLWTRSPKEVCANCAVTCLCWQHLPGVTAKSSL